MLLILVFCALFAVVTCRPGYQDSGTPLIPVIRPGDIRDLRADPSKIKYFFFNDSSRGTQVSSTDVDKLTKTAFNASLESVFVIHGWTNSNTSGISTSIRNALLKNHNVNIFVVDWSWYSRLEYFTAVSQVRSIGQCVGDFINETVNKLHVKLNNVRLVGFSLGAHVAGSAGKSLKGQLASIIGIDPAGPGFFQLIPSGRLDSEDAQYVQAIHTNAGTLGCTYSVGHSDFWPNGGSSQPGCFGIDIGGLCSHNRVYELYAESLGTNRFLATKCNCYLSYKVGACRKGETSHMGGLKPNTKARGNYYLDTNSRSPFGKS